MVLVMILGTVSQLPGGSQAEKDVDPLIGAWTVEQTSYPSWHAAFVFSEDGSMTILDSRDQVWKNR
jgi:hypothetical protein